MSDEPALDFRAVIVDIAKLRDYCLSRSHPRGRHKARVFRSRLGMAATEAETLRDALLAAVRSVGRELRDVGSDAYGQRYLLDFEIATPTGTATIRSSWIAPSGRDVLRFVTCYVL